MGENEIEIDDIFDEALETIEPTDNGKTDNSYSEIVENDAGQTFSREEVDEWTSLVNAAKELIGKGELSEDNALEVIQGVYSKYLQDRDIEEAFNQGIKPEDISKEAMELYMQNIGKMTIAQSIEATDVFLDGFLGENRNRSYKRVTKHKSDKFLEGFDSYGK